jgi:ethanolamine utilization protein EutN
MQIGSVVGHAVSTVKHATLSGWRMLLVQPLARDGGPDGEPLLAIDDLGASPASRVILTNDGASVRERIGAKDSPVRWMVIGLCDE